jgi:hypothetical protein
MESSKKAGNKFGYPAIMSYHDILNASTVSNVLVSDKINTNLASQGLYKDPGLRGWINTL